MKGVKNFFGIQLKKKLHDRNIAEDCENDHNKIMTILAISYAFKTFKLIIIIFMVSYFLGMFFYIFSDLTKNLYDVKYHGTG